MSIIFPLFGTGTPQGTTTDGYFLEGTDLKRIKSESFEIDTLFSNVNGFFVDTKENLYTSEGGNVKKYVKNFRTGNFNLAWQASGGFTGGNTLSTNQIDEAKLFAYPFISDFQNVAIDSQFNFYFRDTTDSNKLKKYSAGGQLITSTSSDIGAFAINKDGIFSFSGNTVTKRNLSGNSISSFTVTGTPTALGSNQVFVFEIDSFVFVGTGSIGDTGFNTARGYNLATGIEAWSVDRIIGRNKDYDFTSESVVYQHDFVSMKNGNLLIRCGVRFDDVVVGNNQGESYNGYLPFYGYILISSTGQILHETPKLRFTGAMNNSINIDLLDSDVDFNVTDPAYQGTPFNQYLYTQGANSDRSRLNF